ncbi:MAG: choice-of-anchor D domain-containing protein [Myxococcota bacterium]
MKTWLQLGAAVCCVVMGVACGDEEVSTAEPLPDGPQLVNPGFLAFDLTAPGGQRVSQIPVVNLGRDPLTISGVSIAGQDATRFTLGQPIQSTVNPRQATSIPITFRPNVVGAYVANVTIASNAANFPEFVVDVVAPSGNGDEPNLQVADKTVSITVPAGAPEGRGVLRYYNVGRESLVITGYSFIGAGAASFSLAQGTPTPGNACKLNDVDDCALGLFCKLEAADSTDGTCALSVPVADPVVLDIYYAGTGTQTASLRITPDGGSPVLVTLNGQR